MADFSTLHTAAVEITKRAYAPYSHYPVGAAALGADGAIYTGCNVENASYGLGLCAECGLVSSAVAAGCQKLLAFVCVNRDGDVIMPCGRCRQLLYEFGGPTMAIHTPTGECTMAEVMPQAFGPADLEVIV